MDPTSGGLDPVALAQMRAAQPARPQWAVLGACPDCGCPLIISPDAMHIRDVPVPQRTCAWPCKWAPANSKGYVQATP